MIRVINSRLLPILALLLIGLVCMLLLKNPEQYHDIIIQSIPDSLLQNSQFHFSVSNISKIQSGIDPKTNKVKAAFVVLARNSDLEDFKESMIQLEKTFNKKFNYPYVFLNDKLFTETFKNEIMNLTQAKVEFGLIPEEHWSIPKFLNEKHVLKSIAAQKDKTPYGGVLSYHHMCRYESGLFSQHELVKKYDYYWRVEPGVEFTCDLEDDPFLYMHQNNKKYGFTIMMPEFMETIPTLWKTVTKWVVEESVFLHQNRTRHWFLDEKTKKYNGHHFWSNFEIGSLEMFRSPQYRSYFDYLDKTGGFYFERWGDAPVHSLYAALVLSKDEIHFFDNIGYKHDLYQHCPVDKKYRNKCRCDPSKSSTLDDRILGSFLAESGRSLPKL